MSFGRVKVQLFKSQTLNHKFGSSAAACSATKPAERSHPFDSQQAHPRQKAEFTSVAKTAFGI